MARLEPHRLFLLIALPFGLLFTFLIPPLMGADEVHHYHHVADIAEGALLGDAKVPAWIPELMACAHDHLQQRFSQFQPFTNEAWQDFMSVEPTRAKIKLPANMQSSLYPPVMYLPQALALKVGTWAGMQPVHTVYFVRMAQLLVTIMLIAEAILIVPRFKYLLAFLALLPTMVFFRSSISADPITIGLAFLFVALIFRHRLDMAYFHVQGKDVWMLAAVALLLALCKAAYFFFPFLALLLRREQFATPKAFCVARFAIIVPSVAASVGWLVWVKLTFFNGVSYHSWDDQHLAFPDGQTLYLLQQPWMFIAALFKTWFGTPFLIQAIRGFFAEMGWMDIHPTVAVYAILFLGFLALLRLDAPEEQSFARRERMLMTVLFGLILLSSFALLYIHWTPFKATVIAGFQGRYLYPIVPLLFVWLPVSKDHFKKDWRAGIVGGVSVIALSLSGYALYYSYYVSRI